MGGAVGRPCERERRSGRSRALRDHLEMQRAEASQMLSDVLFQATEARRWRVVDAARV